MLGPGPEAERIRERIEAPNQSVHAPHLLDLEVAHTLRRQSLQGNLSANRGIEAMTDFADIRMTRYPHTSLLERIWALRHNLTAYDAAYVALAEVLGAPLVTRDARLAQASGIDAVVEVY